MDSLTNNKRGKRIFLLLSRDALLYFKFKKIYNTHMVFRADNFPIEDF